MNDDEALATVRAALAEARDTLPSVHMARPASALIARARARRLRRGLYGGVAATAALAVGLLLAGVLPASGTAGQTSRVAQARTVAYVVSRVERAMASTHLVFFGRTSSRTWGPSVTWAYGAQNRFEEFTGKACGHTDANGWCTHHGGSVPFIAQGTALLHGTLRGVYVTYYDRRYSLSSLGVPPTSACSTTAALAMGGPPDATQHWSAFIHTTLACGAAHVTGHVWINGVETTKITGRPVTVKLSQGYSKVVHERRARVQWILWVNPQTYLPVRMYGSTQTFGGAGGTVTSSGVTNVTWLPSTRGNLAKTLVRIPAGFQQVSSSAQQQPGGMGR